MQQMEWREAMDDASSLPQLEALHSRVTMERQVLLQQCADFLDIEHDYAAAVGVVRALMFVDKFLLDLGLRMDPH